MNGCTQDPDGPDGEGASFSDETVWNRSAARKRSEEAQKLDTDLEFQRALDQFSIYVYKQGLMASVAAKYVAQPDLPALVYQLGLISMTCVPAPPEPASMKPGGLVIALSETATNKTSAFATIDTDPTHTFHMLRPQHTPTEFAELVDQTTRRWGWLMATAQTPPQPHPSDEA